MKTPAGEPFIRLTHPNKGLLPQKSDPLPSTRKHIGSHSIHFDYTTGDKTVAQVVRKALRAPTTFLTNLSGSTIGQAAINFVALPITSVLSLIELAFTITELVVTAVLGVFFDNAIRKIMTKRHPNQGVLENEHAYGNALKQLIKQSTYAFARSFSFIGVFAGLAGKPIRFNAPQTKSASSQSTPVSTPTRLSSGSMFPFEPPATPLPPQLPPASPPPPVPGVDGTGEHRSSDAIAALVE